MVKIIPIVKNPKFIVVTKFGNLYLHYHVDKVYSNVSADIGVWNIKYKSFLGGWICDYLEKQNPL